MGLCSRTWNICIRWRRSRRPGGLSARSACEMSAKTCRAALGWTAEGGCHHVVCGYEYLLAGESPATTLHSQGLLRFFGYDGQFELLRPAQDGQRAADADARVGQQAVQVIHSGHGLAIERNDDVTLA